MALPKEEWLDDAMALPIGRAKRVYHGGEHRANMRVQNMHDRYVAYCFSCNEGGVHLKDFVYGAPPVLVQDTLHLDFSKVIPISDMDYKEQSKLHKFLNDKGVHTGMFLGFTLGWSTEAHRLIIQNQDKVLGRDIHNQSKLKWVAYRNYRDYCRCFVGEPSGIVVLTEDLFSAVKIQFYCPYVKAVAINGTVLSTELLNKLQGCHVILALDGDKTGQKATGIIKQRLNLFGYTNGTLILPEDKDPKDMDGIWLMNRIGGLCGR